jgi:subtilase family serine protease
MKHSFTTLTVSLLLALPLAAQNGSSDILRGHSHPPLRQMLMPYAWQPDAVGVAKMREAYGFNQIKNFGQGQVIAIVDAYDDPNIEGDLGVFSTKFQLPACTTANGCFKKVYQTGSKPPADTNGWTNEIAIDVQWAHAIAPLAKIVLVEANSNYNSDLYAAVDVAVQNGASVVSMSWGGSEAPNEAQIDSHFNVKGVTFVASSGDGGHGVEYPAASPYVVAVGGTSLTVDSSGAWVSEKAWSGSGGGTSSFEPEPSYQAGVQTTGKLGIPDVAYDADPSTGVPVYNSYACGGYCPTGWGQWGGTSIGAPQWAALFAIANSARAALGKTNLRYPQFILYAVAPTNYHDITSGTNGNCGAQCTAGAGYDFVTGIGSPQANSLIRVLTAVQ